MVTSAGLDEFQTFTDITIEAWDRMLAVNLTGTFHCLQSAIPDMVAAGWGRIVTISSSSAQSGAARMAHYIHDPRTWRRTAAPGGIRPCLCSIITDRAQLEPADPRPVVSRRLPGDHPSARGSAGIGL